VRRILGFLLASLALSGCTSADASACEEVGLTLRDALQRTESGSVDAEGLRLAADDARTRAAEAEAGGDVEEAFERLADAISRYRTVSVVEGAPNTDVRGELGEAITEVRSACDR
jgi:hypothetical protein